MSKKSTTYADSGVDIDAGDALVELIKPLAKGTKRDGSDTGLSGFGGFFDLKKTGYKDPLLVASTDGVGTKLKIANAVGRHDTIGIDLVAMCVNDIVVQGAEPLFFLDYFATGKLEVRQAHQVIKGIAEGCKQAGCALIGGETAEMPGIYKIGDYDLAGFSVGIVERKKVLPKPNIKTGDLLVGLSSSGVHSNGYSLVRHIVDKGGFSYKDKPKGFKKSLGETLLEPTRIYVKLCLELMKISGVKGFAHITGGGITENLPRVLPKGTGAEIDCAGWKAPEIFKWISANGNVEKKEMLRTFNSGIGMIVVVDPKNIKAVKALLAKRKEPFNLIGKIKKGEGIVYKNLDRFCE